MIIVNNELYVHPYEYSCNILNAAINTIHCRVVTKKALLRQSDFEQAENVVRKQLSKMKLKFKSVRLLRNTTSNQNFDLTIYIS